MLRQFEGKIRNRVDTSGLFIYYDRIPNFTRRIWKNQTTLL